MNTFKNLTLLEVLVIASNLFSCEVPDDGSSSGPIHLEKLFDDQAPKTQSFEIDAEKGGSLITDHRVRYQIHPNAFRTPNGELAKGKVNITIKEVFTIPEMIFSGVLPVNYNENGEATYPLESDGQFFFEARQLDPNVELEPISSRVNVMVPVRRFNPEMRLYVADQNRDDDTVRWELDTISLIQRDSLLEHHWFNMPPLNWINCDAPFLSDLSKSKLELSYAGTTEYDDSRGFLVFKQVNSVYSFYDHVFQTEQTLLYYAKKDDKLLYDLVDIAPPLPSKITLDMKPITKDELVKLVEGLAS